MEEWKNLKMRQFVPIAIGIENGRMKK